MHTCNLTIATPEGRIFSDEIIKISVRGTEGDLAVMAGHIAFITALKPGACHIEMPDGSIKTGKTEGGLLTVSENKISLLSGSFSW